MESDNSLMHRGENEGCQVSVWTPEDATRFLSSAIQEAQRPLTDALKRRSVSPGMFALAIVLLAACAAACGWVLVDRLDKADRVTEQARVERDAATDKRYEIQARYDAAAARLTVSQDLAERTRRELENENERLRTAATDLKAGDEELKRLRGDLNRYRRQNDLLRAQISGLELEKQALARQLAAVTALAESEEGDQIDAPVEPATDIDAASAAPAVQIVPAAEERRGGEEQPARDSVRPEDSPENIPPAEVPVPSGEVRDSLPGTEPPSI